jgi:outer membrane protein assembly factor BamB
VQLDDSHAFWLWRRTTDDVPCSALAVAEKDEDGMEESIPDAATFAASAARTFEYRTTGVLTSPHVRWSFSPSPGKHISCPVLVARDVVYVGDSAGYFSALDALSGDLLWSFAADQVEGPRACRRDSDYFSGIIATCLVGSLGYVVSANSRLRRGYATYTSSTLSQLELPSDRVLHCWDCEELLGSVGRIQRDVLPFVLKEEGLTH